MENMLRQLMAAQNRPQKTRAEVGPERKTNAHWNHVIDPEQLAAETGQNSEHLLIQLMEAKKSQYSKRQIGIDRK